MSFLGDYVKENERQASFFDGQDWTEVKIRGKPKTTTSAQTTQKQSFTPNSHRTGNPSSHERKLEQSTDQIKLKKLTSESKQQIVTYRMSKKLSQDQLNQECRFPVNTIREIEAGRLTPSTAQLNTLNRVLKTGLRLE
jgi:ribosome-binding protein aMBF1 (putative translation factor)